MALTAEQASARTRKAWQKRRRPTSERFWERVDKRGPDECWSWTRGKVEGYGRIRIDGQMVRAHRYAYEEIVGPIPEGLTLDHLCRNRGCCNPAHLEPVPNAENVMRGDGPAARNARKDHCVRGHPLTPENVRLYRGKRICKMCVRLEGRRRRARAFLASLGETGT